MLKGKTGKKQHVIKKQLCELELTKHTRDISHACHYIQ
jgi:hypothetical protein